MDDGIPGDSPGSEGSRRGGGNVGASEPMDSSCPASELASAEQRKSAAPRQPRRDSRQVTMRPAVQVLITMSLPYPFDSHLQRGCGGVSQLKDCKGNEGTRKYPGTQTLRLSSGTRHRSLTADW